MRILPLLIILLGSCSKSKDLSDWNTDRRPQVILISQRYTDPPKWLNDKEWKPDTTIYVYYDRSTDTMAYHGQKPDTSHSVCPIQGSASNLFWEIRIYQIKTFN